MVQRHKVLVRSCRC